MFALSLATAIHFPDVNLTWMSGSWRTEVWGGVMEEHWTAPAGKTLIGMNRVVTDGKTVHREFIEIELGDPATLRVTVASSNPPRNVLYTLKKVEKARAVFINPEHERLHTMTYWRDQTGLHCLLEGKRQEKTYREQFDFKLMPSVAGILTP